MGKEDHQLAWGLSCVNIQYADIQCIFNYRFISIQKVKSILLQFIASCNTFKLFLDKMWCASVLLLRIKCAQVLLI